MIKQGRHCYITKIKTKPPLSHASISSEQVGILCVGIPCVGIPYVGMPYFEIPYVGIPYVGIPYVDIPYIGLPYIWHWDATRGLRAILRGIIR